MKESTPLGRLFVGIRKTETSVIHYAFTKPYLRKFKKDFSMSDCQCFVSLVRRQVSKTDIGCDMQRSINR